MTAPYFDDGTVKVFLGDCLDVLRTLPDASVDAVVCEPPYALELIKVRLGKSISPVLDIDGEIA